MKDRLKVFLIILIFSAGAFMRFYKLDWGDGYFFHPDEYHIVNSVNQLSFPNQMNPNFFSYGSFTVYLIYFTKLVLIKLGFIVNYPQVFFIGRFYSALYSTLTLAVIYMLSRVIFKKFYVSLVVTLLAVLIPGSVQQAHFLTPESSLTFWLLLSILLILFWSKSKNDYLFYLSGIALGIALAVKIVALVILPIYLLTLLSTKPSLKILKVNLIKFIIFVVIATLTFLIFFPYSFIDWEHFRRSLNYEGSVAGGSQMVFYTRQFINTYPFLFQFQKIFSYALGPALLISGMFGFLILVYKVLKKSQPHFFILVTFLLIFIPNALLYAKWTRFVAPTFPFWVLFTGFLIESVEKRGKKLLTNFLLTIIIASTTFWSLMFFSIYLKKDVRVIATEWVKENVKPQSIILTESRNMLEVPLSGNYRKIIFDFYDIDENPFMLEKLTQDLVLADYFIIQGRRIYKNHQRLSYNYPLINNFYTNLFDGKLGFIKLAEFTSYPQLTLGNFRFEIPDEDAEETWSVFDHPKVIVFKKEVNLSKDELLSLINNN